MKQSLLSSVLLVTLGAAGMAHAGTVYVPLPGQAAVGTATYEVQVSIANTGATATVNQALLPSDSDGTQRAGVTASALGVNGGQTSVVKPGATFSGLLELSGAADFRYSARLVNVGAGGLGTDLPLITSSTVTKANGKLSVQGLISAGTRTVDLALVNLATAAGQCTVNLARSDGSAIGAAATVSMNPLSHRYFTNVLSGLVDASGVADARAQVSCSQDFFAYGVLKNSATGEMTLVQPAASGDSTFGGSGGNPPPSGGGCGSPGVTCFDASGLVHQPTPTNPVGRVTFAIPQGTYGRIKMSMDVTVGPWYAPQPDAKHLIYWFVIDKNIDMPGLLYFRGPAAYTALVRHGIGLTHPQKLKIVQPFQGVPGHTYHIVNDYDMAHHSYTVTITDKGTGEVKAQLVDAPNVSQYTSRPGQHFIIDMGFRENLVPDEVPSYNWLYQNIHIEAYRN